jgi:hypothetical protein
VDRLTKSIFIFLALAITFIVLLVVVVERVPVRTYGVKQFIWAGGIETKDYAPGYHIGVTGLHKWHFLDASTHFLDFVEQADERTGGMRRKAFSIFPQSSGASSLERPVYTSQPALEIRNRDGNIVTIDVSVPYRIKEGQAHQIVEKGLKATYQDRVKATVESVLRQVLPEMSNEALQDTELRQATAEKALGELNKELEQFFVEAEAVLIRRFSFPKDYEDKLQDKQLLTQQALLDQAETLRLAEELRTGTIQKEIVAAEALSTAEWEQKLESLRKEYALKVAAVKAEAVQYSKKTKAEADALYEVKIAEGKLAIDKAEASLDRLRMSALATDGGQFYLARLAAQNLNLEAVTLNASDPRLPVLLDVHGLSQLLLGMREPPPPVSKGGLEKGAQGY